MAARRIAIEEGARKAHAPSCGTGTRRLMLDVRAINSRARQRHQ
jgi:hypothetical protein